MRKSYRYEGPLPLGSVVAHHCGAGGFHAVKDNPALVAMMERAMQRMTVEGMLKQAGADAESIKQLNRVLQGIKKDV